MRFGWSRVSRLLAPLCAVFGLGVLSDPCGGATISVAAGSVDVDSGDGLCSLVEAFESAEDTLPSQHGDCASGDKAGADTIELAPGATYTLTDVHNFWYGPNGLPSVQSAILVVGNGAVIVRSADPATQPFRFFHVGKDFDGDGNESTVGDGHLELRDLVLSGGLARGGRGGNGIGAGGGGAGLGGAILSQGTLVLERVTLVGNAAEGGAGGDGVFGFGGGGGLGGAGALDRFGGGGGGFRFDGQGSTGGGFTAPAPGVEGGTGNEAGTSAFGGDGGEDASFSEFQGFGGGGGGFAADGGSAEVGFPVGAPGGGEGGGGCCSNSGGAGGAFGGGGGGSAIVGGGGGGGVGGGGGSGFVGGGGGFGGGGGGGTGRGLGGGGLGGFGGGGGAGPAQSEGGAGGFGGGSAGGAGSSSESPEVDRHGGGGGGGLGGALFNHEGSATLINCTLTGNETRGGDGGDGVGPGGSGGGGGGGLGGAVFNLDGTLSLKHVTLSGNTAVGGGGGVAADASGIGAPGLAAGAGIFQVELDVAMLGSPAASLELLGSIVADGIGAGDCEVLAGSDASGANNLVEANGSPGCPGVTETSDPLLGPLAANGGFTPTMAPGEASPAIDVAGDCLAVLATPEDQRRMPRPIDGGGAAGAACDIGAVEVGAGNGIDPTAIPALEAPGLFLLALALAGAALAALRRG